jgi:hypothetical protein
MFLVKWQYPFCITNYDGAPKMYCFDSQLMTAAAKILENRRILNHQRDRIINISLFAHGVSKTVPKHLGFIEGEDMREKMELWCAFAFWCVKTRF